MELSKTLNLHEYISSQLTDYLHNYYYSILQKKENKKITDLLLSNQSSQFIFKPEYLIYLLFYQIFLLSHNWSQKNIIFTNVYLHLYYITYLLESNIRNKYNYNSPFDTNILKEISNYLFNYIIFYKINYSTSSFSIIQLFLPIFSFLINYHEIHKNRLLSLEHKVEPEHSIRKLLIFTPNKKNIQKIVYYTRHFHFSNFPFFISICSLFFL